MKENIICEKNYLELDSSRNTYLKTYVLKCKNELY